MRVLVTGASGFVGLRLARCLVARGHRVGGTFISDSPRTSEFDLFEADLLDLAAMEEVLDRVQPDAVLHLAGLSHVGESWSRMADYFRVNVLGTENLLRLACGKRVVAASSAEVYGPVPEGEQPISEERMPAPQSPYALTKAAMERLVLGEGGLVVRSFNAVGPGQASKFALPAFAGQLASIREGRQEPVLRVGNLEARRDFLHVDDAVEGYRAALEGGDPGGIYNLGRGRALSVGEVLDKLIAISGVDCRIEIDRERFRPVDLPLLTADCGRLQKLGWVCRRSLEDALRDLWHDVSGSGQIPAPC